MNPLVYLLIFLWFLSIFKSSLFWLYLLQLKEYKIKRFLDHFRTAKGKRLLLDKLNFLTVGLLLISPLLNGYFLYCAILLYILKTAVFLKHALDKSLKRPDFTSKSLPIFIILLALNAFLALLFLFIWSMEALVTWLLLLDFGVSVMAAALVMMLKPLNQILRRHTLRRAITKRRELKDLLVIGITGSYGKTSTKEFLYEILKNRFKVIKTEEHQNTEIAVANLILNKLKPSHQIFICEMGAYEKGEVREISEIAQPKIGVFLGANEQHLALFGSMENLLSAEGGKELLDSLPQGGLGIFNGNNRHAYDLYKSAQSAKRITYVPNLVDIVNPEKRDVRAENIETYKDHITFRVLSNKDSRGVEFRVDLLGAHNIENILLAVAVAEELGLSLEEISTACRRIKPLARTMNIERSNGGFSVINSTYSSNPTAVKAHLEYLKAWEGSKRIVVMPCLIELGSASSKVHHQIGRDLARTVDLAIITTKDKFDEILSGAHEIIGEEAKNRVIFSENPAFIINRVKETLGKNDVVLLEGRLQPEIIKGLIN